MTVTTAAATRAATTVVHVTTAVDAPSVAATRAVTTAADARLVVGTRVAMTVVVVLLVVGTRVVTTVAVATTVADAPSAAATVRSVAAPTTGDVVPAGAGVRDRPDPRLLDGPDQH